MSEPPRPRERFRRLLRPGDRYTADDLDDAGGEGVDFEGLEPDPNPPPVADQHGGEHEGGPGDMVITGPFGEMLAVITLRPGWGPRRVLEMITGDGTPLRDALTLLPAALAERRARRGEDADDGGDDGNAAHGIPGGDEADDDEDPGSWR